MSAVVKSLFDRVFGVVVKSSTLDRSYQAGVEETGNNAGLYDNNNNRNSKNNVDDDGNDDNDDDDDDVGLGYDRIAGIDGSNENIDYEIELRQLTGAQDDDDDDDNDGGEEEASGDVLNNNNNNNNKSNANGDQGDKAKKSRKRNALLEKLVPPNFGSKSNLNDRSEILIKASHKKDIYLDLTAIFGIALLVICSYEMIMLIHFEQTTIFAKFLLSLLIFHVGSIYTFILSFIYANECGLVTNYYLSILYGAIAIIAFILRTIFEIQYGPFFPASIKGFV